MSGGCVVGRRGNPRRRKSGPFVKQGHSHHRVRSNARRVGRWLPGAICSAVSLSQKCRQQKLTLANNGPKRPNLQFNMLRNRNCDGRIPVPALHHGMESVLDCEYLASHNFSNNCLRRNIRRRLPSRAAFAATVTRLKCPLQSSRAIHCRETVSRG